MLNHIDIMGRLTADPQLKTTQNGVSYASFTIACDRDFGDKKADFIRVKAWRQTADFVGKYFRKGQMAVVSGRLQSEDWTDKDGNKAKLIEIQAEHVYFGSKAESGETKFTELPANEGDLPF